MQAGQSFRSRFGVLPLAVVLLIALPTNPMEAAKTKGDVRVLCIRVNFKDKKDAPSFESVRNRIRAAKNNFERFSYGKMRMQYQVTSVNLPRIRSYYNGSRLANAAELQASKKGFRIGSYDLIGFYYGGGPVGGGPFTGL